MIWPVQTAELAAREAFMKCKRKLHSCAIAIMAAQLHHSSNKLCSQNLARRIGTIEESSTSIGSSLQCRGTRNISLNQDLPLITVTKGLFSLHRHKTQKSEVDPQVLQAPVISSNCPFQWMCKLWTFALLTLNKFSFWDCRQHSFWKWCV